MITIKGVEYTLSKEGKLVFDKTKQLTSSSTSQLAKVGMGTNLLIDLIKYFNGQDIEITKVISATEVIGNLGIKQVENDDEFDRHFSAVEYNKTVDGKSWECNRAFEYINNHWEYFEVTPSFTKSECILDRHTKMTLHRCIYERRG